MNSIQKRTDENFGFGYCIELVGDTRESHFDLLLSELHLENWLIISG